MSCVINGTLHLQGCNRNETFGCKTKLCGEDKVNRVSSPVKHYNIYTDKDIPQHMIECWERNTKHKL